MTLHPPSATTLRIGDWSVSPASGQISRNGETVRVDARAMRLLICLAERAGEVVSIDDLLKQVWPEVVVSPDSVYQAVASLRRVLGDDPKQPAYIATVPRLGYRMVAAVSPSVDQLIAPTNPAPVSSAGNQTMTTIDAPMPAKRRRTTALLIVGAALFLALVVAFLFYGKVANNNAPAKSIAVLPFIDLSEGMQQEYFADGMTEELINRLSKVPGVRVQQTTIADVAKKLRVAYVLDGSVRKSGARLRVAARLIRTDNGFVVWSETYDRPFDDILMVQDDIAGEVTKALQNVR